MLIGVQATNLLGSTWATNFYSTFFDLRKSQFVFNKIRKNVPLMFDPNFLNYENSSTISSGNALSDP